MILSIILAVLLALVVFGNVARSLVDLGGPGRLSGHRLEEVVAENNGSANKIAVVEVEGLITSQAWDGVSRDMVDLIVDQLKMAEQDKLVKAVILKVDSPGGEVMASDRISQAIAEFQEKTGKPVVASMGGLAASGGYYVSAPCQWIVANELTMTGSIGVIMHSFNYRGLLDKVGLYPQVFKSGKFKDMLRGSKKLDEIDPKEAEMIQDIIDETYRKFTRVVEDGRSRALKKNNGEGKTLDPGWKQYADGRILTGQQAFELGFVDEKGNFNSAVSRARKLAKISDANLVRYREPLSFANLLGIFGKANTKALKLDLGLEWPKVEAGRLYFLSPTVLH